MPCPSSRANEPAAGPTSDHPARAFQGDLHRFNLGVFGVCGFAAGLNLPQACILGFGAIEERSAVRDDELVVASLMRVPPRLIVYGADAARLLGANQGDPRGALCLAL